MRDKIDKLWVQTRIATIFHYDIVYVLSLIIRKLQVVCGRSTYRMTVLHSEMSVFYVRAGCEIPMASYTSKRASQSLSDKPFLRIYSVLRHIHTHTCSLKTSGHMWTFSISNNCYIIRDVLCVVYSCTRDPTG